MTEFREQVLVRCGFEKGFFDCSRFRVHRPLREKIDHALLDVIINL